MRLRKHHEITWLTFGMRIIYDYIIIIIYHENIG